MAPIEAVTVAACRLDPVFGALVFSGSYCHLQGVTATRGNQEMIAIMSMAQVSLGLLRLSVSAATSLAEERVRSSLDVLLCTPLSTHSILIGKWWGTFQQAAHILAWPAVLAGILVMESGRWISYLLLLGLIMANSAVITSLGLVMATWVSRLGRAVTLCVSAYVVFSIGWILLVFLLAKPGQTNDQFLVPMVMGSPLYGTLVATAAVVPGGLQHPGGAYSANLRGIHLDRDRQHGCAASFSDSAGNF